MNDKDKKEAAEIGKLLCIESFLIIFVLVIIYGIIVFVQNIETLTPNSMYLYLFSFLTIILIFLLIILIKIRNIQKNNKIIIEKMNELLKKNDTLKINNHTSAP